MEQTPRFGGEPGEPVPQVDPKDVKAAWELCRDVERGRPPESKGGIAICTSVYERVCTPGANVIAVAYRTLKLNLLSTLNPEFLAPWTTEGKPQDVLFRAIALVSMEWLETGVTYYGPPFDLEQFDRLLHEAE